jgi:hypothetical protein
LQKLHLFPFNLKIKIHTRKILVYVALYNTKYNTISSLVNNNKANDTLKFKVLQIYLQQNIQGHFNKKIKFFFNNIFNYLSLQQKIRSQHIYSLLKNQRNFKFNLVDFINIINICLSFKTPYILIKYFASVFSTVKKHRTLVFLFRRLIKEFLPLYRNLLGLKLKISGKINGASRTRHIIFLEGKVALSSKTADIYYAFTNVITFTGIFGIKLWFNF